VALLNKINSEKGIVEDPFRKTAGHLNARNIFPLYSLAVPLSHGRYH
jgi:hypothetical protein